VAWAKAYLHTKWHLDLPSRLVKIDMGGKVGGCCAPFWGGELGRHLHNVARADAYLRAKFYLDPSKR